VESGEHLKVPHVEMHRIRALRIIPESEDVGHLTVDGEELTGEERSAGLQAVIEPGIARARFNN